jgi:hypothetical protein
MAAPIVAGAIALVASQAPQLSGVQLKEIMFTSAFKLSHLEGVVAGGRFLNLGSMAELAAQPSDQCPSDPDKTTPGECGCGVADTDSDGDGVANCKDSCPSDLGKTSPGACGCGVTDTDSDGDGVANCKDSCPNDSGKTSLGACGCGVADTDSDGDGTPNCQDSCPSDGGKTTPGACGCGIADTDVNGNGKIDCLDTGLTSIVPQKPQLTVRGRNVFISMAPSTGVNYYLQISLIPTWETGKKRQTKIYVVSSPVVKMPKPPRRWGVRVRYAYLAKGSDRDFSYWSHFTNQTMR